MVNTSSSKFADNLIHLAVPLAVVAGLMEYMGVPIGHISTVLAAALTAFIGTPVRYFGERPLAKALGTTLGSFQLYLALAAINAIIAAASVAVIGGTVGY